MEGRGRECGSREGEGGREGERDVSEFSRGPEISSLAKYSLDKFLFDIFLITVLLSLSIFAAIPIPYTFFCICALHAGVKTSLCACAFLSLAHIAFSTKFLISTIDNNVFSQNLIPIR